MLLSHWRRELWLGTNSWRKGCVQNCTIVLDIFLLHVKSFLHAYSGCSCPKSRRFLKALRLLGIPNDPESHRQILKIPYFVPRVGEPAQKLMDANCLGDPGVNWLWKTCGKWQPKSKDLLNTKFVLRWIAIITATSVARIVKPKITSETLFEIMISQHKLEYQDYQSGGVGHLLGRIPFPSHFPINILNCFFTFPAFFPAFTNASTLYSFPL